MPSMLKFTTHSRASASWTTHAAFIVASSLACLGWSWFAGRDLNWDQLNYHLYSAYQFLDGRLEQDFMAASIQGYLNPIAHVPFYLMVRAGWHSLLIGPTLALAHSICLWLIYGISCLLIPAGTAHRTLLIAVSVALAFVAPIYLLEVGSTFIDVTTAIPVLGGVLLLMTYSCRRQGWMLVAAALLMGSATGLKLTNSIFTIAAAAFVLMSSRRFAMRFYDLVIYVVGSAAGFLLFEGIWAYRLFKAFGNPFFPFLNTLFSSPDFARVEIRHQ